MSVCKRSVESCVRAAGARAQHSRDAAEGGVWSRGWDERVGEG